MTLLTIGGNVAKQTGFAAPTVIYGSIDQTAVQLLAIINDVGKEITKRHDWQVLVKETSFSTLAAETQTSLPSGFDHIINDVMYNRSTQRKIFGPATIQAWQRSNSTIVTAIDSMFRIRGNSILFEPNPTASQTVYYEYVSKFWVDTNADGIAEAITFTADSQTAVIDEWLIELGALARFKEAKGLEYAEAYRRYEYNMNLMWARDGARRTLNITGPIQATLYPGNIPDTGFGS